jgi:hypothetical protein
VTVYPRMVKLECTLLQGGQNPGHVAAERRGLVDVDLGVGGLLEYLYQSKLDSGFTAINAPGENPRGDPARLRIGRSYVSG